MVRSPMFVVLDDTPHVLAGDEHTPCGILVPEATEWTTTQPDDLCAECADKTGLETTRKASRAKAKA